MHGTHTLHGTEFTIQTILIKSSSLLFSYLPLLTHSLIHTFSISHSLSFFLLISLQVQFLIVFVHTIQIQFQPSCNFPKPIGLLLTFNAGLFTYMFSSFYIRSYNRKHPSKTELNDVDRSKICYSNGTATPVAAATATVDKLNNSIAEKTKEALNVKFKKTN